MKPDSGIQTKVASTFPDRHLGPLICLVIIVITVMVFWQVSSHDFVNIDDSVYVSDNAEVKSGLTADNVAWAFTTTRANFWHPLTWLSYMLDTELFGVNPGGYHFTNLLLHILNILLIFHVFRRMTGDVWKSSLVAALFAIHPLHVESVAWISQRKDVLSTLFWVLTMLAYLRYVERPSEKRYLLILLIFVFGFMAKPMLVTLPFVLLLMDLWPLDRVFHHAPINIKKSQYTSTIKLIKRNTWALVREKLPLFIITTVASVAAYTFQEAGEALTSLDRLPMELRIGNAFISYVKYILTMIWPTNLAVFYPHPEILTWWHAGFASLFLVTVSLLAVKYMRSKPWLFVGWFWYLGTLVPVIGLVQVGSFAMADRYTYIPLIGIFIIVAWGVPELFGKWRYRAVVITILTLVSMAGFAVATYIQVGYWSNSVTLFKHTVEVTSKNRIANYNLGNALSKQGQWNEAVYYYKEALKIDPAYTQAYNNLGFAYYNLGRPADAIIQYVTALKISPGLKVTHNNLGNALAVNGELEKAILHYKEAHYLDPAFTKPYINLGNIRFYQSKPEEAIVLYMQALAIDTNSAVALKNMGLAKLQLGKLKEAITHLTKASVIDPGDAGTRNTLATAQVIQEKIKRAVDNLNKILQSDPEVYSMQEMLDRLNETKLLLDRAIDSYQTSLSRMSGFVRENFNANNIKDINLVVKAYDKLRYYVEKIIQLGPGSIDVYYYKACIYALQGRAEKAVAFLDKGIRSRRLDPERLYNDINMKNIKDSVVFKQLLTEIRP